MGGAVRKEASRAYYERNAEFVKSRAKEWARVHQRKYQIEWRKNNPDKASSYNKKAWQKRKLAVLAHYSGAEQPSCACCGWAPPEGTAMLEIDHINGGGYEAAKKRGLTGQSMYHWLVRQQHCALHGGLLP